MEFEDASTQVPGLRSSCIKPSPPVEEASFSCHTEGHDREDYEIGGVGDRILNNRRRASQKIMVAEGLVKLVQDNESLGSS